MTRDYFKRATTKDYTAWDLNCPEVVRHTVARNRFEKIMKRKARRADKKFLKKVLDNLESM